MPMVCCEKCGKRLIERTKGGLWHFKFGRSKGDDFVVDMKIYGSLKLTCLRKSCRHENVLNFLPDAFVQSAKAE